MNERNTMRIVVVGGSGLIGDKVMTALHDAGHEAVAASPAFGIDAFTGQGLDEAMTGADVVVDVSNAPAWDDEKVLRFFTTVTRNALEAGRRAGARHHVALSVLGCDRLPESGYLRAKVAQEELIRGAQVPFTIVRSTEPPAHGVVETAGPEVFAFQDVVAGCWPRRTIAVASSPIRTSGISGPRCGTASSYRGPRRASRPCGWPTGCRAAARKRPRRHERLDRGARPGDAPRDHAVVVTAQPAGGRQGGRAWSR
jgi:hypothetical protein